MNKYIRTAFCLPFGFAKMCITKLFHFNEVDTSLMCVLSPRTEITVERGANLKIARMLKMRDGAKIRVRRGATCIIGDKVAMGTDTIITCRDRIEIGAGSQLAPNVLIYDHDHDFRGEQGLNDKNYNTSPIIIGKKVWIGANVVILRGTTIGDNTVIGAGSVIKGDYPPNAVVIQKRQTEIRAGGGILNSHSQS